MSLTLFNRSFQFCRFSGAAKKPAFALRRFNGTTGRLRLF
jgi:hypothetical protein